MEYQAVEGKGINSEKALLSLLAKLNVVITEKGEDILDDGLKQRITESVKRWNSKRVLFLRCPRCNEDIQHLVIGDVLDEIKNVANEKDVDVNLMVATVMLYANKICNTRGGNKANAKI